MLDWRYTHTFEDAVSRRFARESSEFVSGDVEVAV
jgi:hypothetical protein